jgi:hypothetical protein
MSAHCSGNCNSFSTGMSPREERTVKLADLGRSVREMKRSAVLGAAIAASTSAGVAAAADKFWVGPWGTWSTGTNWSPSGMPTAGDAVNIGDVLAVHDLQVFLDVNPTLSKLHLFNGITMDNRHHPITVSGATTIAAFNDHWSRLYLRDAVNPYDLNTGDLNILGGSSLFTVDTPTIFVNGTMNLDFDSSLIGAAVINFTGNAGPVLVMNGRWSTNPVDKLTLNQMGTGRIDLDGTTIGDNFLLTASTDGGYYQTLTINGTGLTDEFDDIFWMSQGNELNMNLSEGWALGGNGKIWLRDKYITDSAKVNGGTLTVNGTIEFETGLGDIHGMLADINAPTVFNFSSDVIVGGYDTLNVNGASTVNSGSFALVGNGHNRLKFNGPTKLMGGTFTTTSTDSQVHFNGPTQWGGTVTINGTAVQNGTATVSTATVIDADRLDMDGDTHLTTWNIGAPLTINAEKLDLNDNLMSGTINVYSALLSPAALTVNLPAGQKWTAGGLVKLTGSGLGVSTTLAGSDVGFGGGLEVTKANAITARADFLLGSATTINANSALHLLGGNLAMPNTISGAWMQGAGTLAAGTGRALVGNGSISNAIDFEGTAQLRAKGGTLQLSGNILDVGVIGTADNTGVLKVTQPWNSAVADKVELLGGQVIGATLTNDGSVVGHGTLGMAHLVNNGSIAASNGAATLTINVTSLAGPDLDGTTEAGQLLAVNGNVRVVDFVEPFNGSVQVGSGRSIHFENGWTNNGTTTLTGTSNLPAVMSGGATQLHGGTLSVNGVGALGAGHTVLTNNSTVNLDLNGATPGASFDRIVATGSVTLGGKLSLSVGGGYDPALLSAHEIMSVGARHEVFASIAGVALSPTKYLAVSYDDDSVFVTVARPGDADLNGSVTLADFNTLAGHFGTGSGAVWTSGDFTGDGAVTLPDFNALAANFGLSAGPAGPSVEDWSSLAALVPEPVWTTWGLGALLPLVRHRGRRLAGTFAIRTAGADQAA